jgi:hypothetical protein
MAWHSTTTAMVIIMATLIIMAMIGHFDGPVNPIYRAAFAQPSK